MRRDKSPEIAQTLEELRPKLAQYLVECGVDISDRGWFTCINPEHRDNSPSMHLDPYSGNQRAKCFSCGANVDIFSAAVFLEKKPDSGPGWVRDNVGYLAAKYGVAFEERELTAEEKTFLEIEKLYEFVADFIKQMAAAGGDYTKYAESRGVTVETCAKYGVACIPWNDLHKALVKAKFDLFFAAKFGIDETMFNGDSVTFTLKDRHGNVIGFARKYLPYDKAAAQVAKRNKSPYPPKYKNTSSLVPFFDKAGFLYGLDTVDRSSKRIDLFEGYWDVLVGKQLGIANCAGTCGITITSKQVKVLQELGYSHININFDNEPRGIAASRELLGTIKSEDLTVTATYPEFKEDVPADQRDPDTFLLKYGVDSYFKTPLKTWFEVELDFVLTNKDLSKAAIVEAMVQHIVEEPSKTRQGQMIRTLATKTGFNEDDIRNDVARRTDAKVLLLTADLARKLTNTRDSKKASNLIQEVLSKMETGEKSTVDLSFEESYQAFCTVVSKNEAVVEGLSGWDTGWPEFNQNFDGLPKEGQIIGVSGASNCGKSAWVTTLASNLLTKNTEGLTVVYHILDDPRAIAFDKLLSCITGLPIRYITHVPQYINKDPDLKARYEAAREWLGAQLKSKRLIVKGQEMGNGTPVARQLIDRVIAETGNKVVYIGDSLHSLDDQANNEERIRFKRVAEWTMLMTETRPLSMVFTVELNKHGMDGRPRLSDLAESGKLIYALKAIGMFYNELHDKRSAATSFWTEEIPDATGKTQKVKRPIIEVDWSKNKISEFKGVSYLRFYDNIARVEELTLEDLNREKENARRMVREQPNDAAIGNLRAQNSTLPRGFFAPV